jgi:peptidoglycan/LPS O-acetylase OafA/YrhL
LAVNGFFAISGFLVAASLIKRGMIDYAISRILRIYPALILCVFVSVFVLGPLFTSLSLNDYFDHPRTWSYLNNAFAVFKMQWTLPGVFEQNSRDAFNGSLWTLTVEVYCYILLAALTFLGFRLGRLWGNTLVLIIFAVGVISFDSIPLVGINPRWSRPALYFIVGVFLFLNRDKILLDRRIAFLAAILAFFSFGEDWFDYIFPPAITYLIFFLAYTTKPIRTDAVVGDISYGIYIYAWPCQQIVANLFPGQTPYFNMLVSSLIVIPLAWVSWHYVERRVLSYKKVLLGHADPKMLLQRTRAILAKKRA